MESLARRRAWIREQRQSPLWHTRRDDSTATGRPHGSAGSGREALVRAALEKRLTAPTAHGVGGGGLSRDEGRVFDEMLTSSEYRRLSFWASGLTMTSGPTTLTTARTNRSATPPGHRAPGRSLGQGTRAWRGLRPGGAIHAASGGRRRFRARHRSEDLDTYANKSDGSLALVRTRRNQGKKQIEDHVLLIDMATPGVSTRPIETYQGWSPFCRPSRR